MSNILLACAKARASAKHSVPPLVERALAGPMQDHSCSHCGPHVRLQGHAYTWTTEYLMRTKCRTKGIHSLRMCVYAGTFMYLENGVLDENQMQDQRYSQPARVCVCRVVHVPGERE
jgi:hypothetical protein